MQEYLSTIWGAEADIVIACVMHWHSVSDRLRLTDDVRGVIAFYGA